MAAHGSARPRAQQRARVSETLAFLIRHGEPVLFTVVLIDQFGVPFPAVPWLLAVGALSRTGQANLATMAGLAIAASILSHAFWYEAGRQGMGNVLKLVCRLSLEPDACVRRTKRVFARRGAATLILAYFLPGFGLVAQPLAGMLGMSRPRFLALTLLGAILWTGSFLGIGYVLSHQIERVGAAATQLGGSLLAVLVAAFAAYIGWKLFQRQRALRSLRVARIHGDELKQRLEANDPVVVVDLRHALDFEADPRTIPGAIHIPFEELDQRLHEIPLDREIVLYCS
jgi:membrane protein DedA with SNARE-associated domain